MILADPPDPVESVLSFFTLEDIGAACNVSNWTVAEEIRIVTQIARGEIPGVKPRDRLVAANHLRRLFLMAARMGGHITDTKTTGVLTTDDGTRHATLTRTEHTTKLLTDSISNTQRALEAAVAGGHYEAHTGPPNAAPKDDDDGDDGDDDLDIDPN